MSDSGKKNEFEAVAGFVFDMFWGDAKGRVEKTAHDIDVEVFGNRAPATPTTITARPVAKPVFQPTPRAVPSHVLDAELVADDDD